MQRRSYPYYLGNEPLAPNEDLEVLDKYRGTPIARVALADPAAIDRAIAAAVRAKPAMAALAAFERRRILDYCVRRFEERAEELADLLCQEAGKPIKDSRGEVVRLIDTFRIAAEETVRLDGEILALDRAERSRDYLGMVRRFPIGPCSFISPFNFPLNLVAHKIAPALAVGSPFILKPASATPLGALIIGEILAEAGLPSGAFSILPCRREGAGLFCTDERLALLSFTGSPEVGWDLKHRAGKKKVVLELGGNAACIVTEDAEFEDTVQRLVLGAFYQSGQSCISVQRIIVHEAVAKTLTSRLVRAAEALPCGDPRDEKTFIGPLITEDDAVRVLSLVEEAVTRGARLLCGGTRAGSVVAPTLLEGVPRDCTLYRREVFGPVAMLSTYRDFSDALAEVNDSEYGLQAGLFSRNLHQIHRAWAGLEVGGLVVGDVPSFRVDSMPYGGVKASGFGREGVRYAMEEMTEPRLLVLRRPAG